MLELDPRILSSGTTVVTSPVSGEWRVAQYQSVLRYERIKPLLIGVFLPQELELKDNDN